jgi:hypothetical protein
MKNMEVLHENKVGLVAQCNCCNEIQIHIDNVILNLTIKEFTTFLELFNKIDINELNKNKSLEKIIIITPFNKVSLKLSTEEINNLSELLNISNVMLNIKSLINA